MEMGGLPIERNRRMIVTMSEARARKNASDREKGIERLEKKFKTGLLKKGTSTTAATTNS